VDFVTGSIFSRASLFEIVNRCFGFVILNFSVNPQNEIDFRFPEDFYPP